MEIWHIWIFIGIALLIVEIFTPGFFVGSVAVGAMAAAVAAAAGGSATIQTLSMAVGILITFIFIRPIVYNFLGSSPSKQTGVYALIGQEAIVLSQIRNCTNEGRIKIRGEEWKACSLTGEIIEEGEIVVVKRIEGVTAYVVARKGE